MSGVPRSGTEEEPSGRGKQRSVLPGGSGRCGHHRHRGCSSPQAVITLSTVLPLSSLRGEAASRMGTGSYHMLFLHQPTILLQSGELHEVFQC